ncbi:MAG TPA: glutaredoxin family protein [Mycobacteriales bacterium]|nr:glutaredoxin family protein [Mycobacteriales bacterium]
MPEPARVEVITRVDCHLCDVTKADLTRLGIPFVERDVDADPVLRDEHGDYVPVVLVDGRQVAWGRVDPEKVARAVRRRGRRLPR